MSSIPAESRRIAVIAAPGNAAAVREALAALAPFEVHELRAGAGVRELLADLERVAPSVILAEAPPFEIPILASWTGAPVVGIGTEAPPPEVDLHRSRDDAGHALHFIAGRSCAAWAATWDEGARAARRLIESLPAGGANAGSVPPGPTTHEALAGVLELWRAILARRPGVEMAWAREFARRLTRREAPASDAEQQPEAPRRTRARVAIVLHEFSRTGSPLLMLRNARALLADPLLPWDLDVVGLQAGPLEEEFAALGIPTSCIPAGRDDGTDWLLEHLDALDPDVVLLHGSPLFREAVALKTRGHRVLWWIHTGIHYDTREGSMIADVALAQIVRHALGFPDRVLFGSRDTLEQFTKLNPALKGRGAHIPNGLAMDEADAALRPLAADRAALRRSLGLDPADVVLVGLGSLEERKNQLGLVRGFQAALRRLPRALAARATLVLVGPLTCQGDPEARYLASLKDAVAAEWADRVRLAGPAPAGWSWLAAADAHVLISINECAPVANLEALAAGIPCLSSRVHGIPETIDDGVTGWLVDPRNEGEVASAIERVLRLGFEDPGALQKMGRAGRETVTRRFSSEVAAAMLRSEIACVLKEASDDRRAVPGGGVARAYFGDLLMLRWALAKGDLAAARGFAQAHAHRLYEWTSAPRAKPAVAVVHEPGEAQAERLIAELRDLELPWTPVPVPGAVSGSAEADGRWSGVLAAIAATGAVVVVAAGDALAELVLLARWKGWSPIWVAGEPSRGGSPGPEFLLEPGRRLEMHARAAAVKVVPAEADAVVAAVDCANGRGSLPDAAPDGPTTWRELDEQLTLFRAIFARDGAVETRICLANAARWAGAAAPRPPAPRAEPRRPRVLFVTHQYSRTGAPIELFHLLRALIAGEAGLECLVTGFEDGPMRDVIERDAGVPALLLKYDDPPWIFDSFLAQIDAIDPDLVILNASVFYQESAVVRLKGRRVVWWIHDGIDLEARRGHLFSDDVLATMTLHGLVYPDRFFFPAQDTLDQFAACLPAIRGRSVHVRNGIDLRELAVARRRWLPERRRLRREAGIGEQDFVFLCIGSFERRKNQLELLRHFQDLREAEPGWADAHLLFLGNPRPSVGSDEAGYFEEVTAAVREPHRRWVRFLGLEPTPYPRLAIADAHVLVSTNESSPLANLEAMAFGVPCLSSRIDGIPEALGAGERGFLVDPNDGAAIRQALIDVRRRVGSGDPGISAMCERARVYVEREHDIGATARLVAREIRAILAERTAEADSEPALRTVEADRYVRWQIVQRWSTFKKDIETEAHIARANAHRFWSEGVTGSSSSS